MHCHVVGARARRGLAEAGGRFQRGDEVPLWANVVGPFHNPSETYRYYDLPFCRPSQMGRPKRVQKRQDVGEVLEGDRLVTGPYQMPFRVDKPREELCTVPLKGKELEQLQRAVRDDYYFQMYYDDLPIWGFLGKVEKLVRAGVETEERLYLFTHFSFDILYNEDRVIQIDVSTDPLASVDITPGGGAAQAEFSFSVQWRETELPFERRMEKYSKHSFLPEHMEIHWFSIINSCVTVLLLTGFLATILARTLRQDISHFSKEVDLEGAEDERGWKYLHADVFRFPQHKSLFCAAVGTGTQILYVSVFIFFLALVGFFYSYDRGTLLAAGVFTYALTSGIAGFSSGRLYKQMGGENWVRNVLLTSVLFYAPLFAVFVICNTVAIAYRSTAALPLGTILSMVLLWALFTFPSTVFGAIVAKNRPAPLLAPQHHRTARYPRAVPPGPWHRAAVPRMALAGFLPFTAIYIELYYIFSSVWGHKVYTIYSVLFVVFAILLVVTAFITVSLTYFQLVSEDHRWWWRSLFCGGSTGLFIFGYSIYYYEVHSEMSGLLQTSFFFGYMAVICYAFFLMLGTVGFRGSLLFVRSIYSAIKRD